MKNEWKSYNFGRNRAWEKWTWNTVCKKLAENRSELKIGGGGIGRRITEFKKIGPKLLDPSKLVPKN